MWLNSTISEEPYQDLTLCWNPPETVDPYKAAEQVLHGCRQHVPWGAPLSGETCATLTLCFICHRELPEIIGRKVRMTPNQHGPLMSWAAHVIQWGWQWAKPQGWGNPIKQSLSPDWGLQFDLMKLESLVIANQPCGDEYVPEACTHRPSSQSSWECPKSPF